MLRFSIANAKTKRLKDIPELKEKYLSRKRNVYSLDLLSGWSCPGAKDCFAKVVIGDDGRKLVDGPHTLFRCFSASQEVAFPNVYNSRKHNFDLLKGCDNAQSITELIIKSIPIDAGIVRFHVGGEFFNLKYLVGAVNAATVLSDVLFYTYTKSLHLLKQIKMLDPTNGIIIDNFLITTSIGGKYDHLIPELGIRTAKVVFTENEAGDLPIDHDDSHAATPGSSFALLLHGIQPKGSIASQALKALKGKGSYSQNGKTI
jgi:hypothetical protein